MARNKWWDQVIGYQKPKPEPDYSRPNYGDCVWRPEHGSGYVKWIDYEFKTVYVIYYDGHRQEYLWDDFEDKYTARCGGYWSPDY